MSVNSRNSELCMSIKCHAIKINKTLKLHNNKNHRSMSQNTDADKGPWKLSSIIQYIYIQRANSDICLRQVTDQVQDVYSFSVFSHQVCTDLTINRSVLLSAWTSTRFSLVSFLMSNFFLSSWLVNKLTYIRGDTEVIHHSASVSVSLNPTCSLLKSNTNSTGYVHVIKVKSLSPSWCVEVSMRNVCVYVRTIPRGRLHTDCDDSSVFHWPTVVTGPLCFLTSQISMSK